jgi:hypothetical protein
MPTVHECSTYFKSGIYAIDWETANNTLKEQLDNDHDDGVSDVAKTEDAAPTHFREGRHRLKGIIVHCGWAIHGIFCDCSGETIGLPMPATASKRKVTYVVPIRKMKSVEITQEEYEKFYESTVNNNSLSISKRNTEAEFSSDCQQEEET